MVYTWFLPGPQKEADTRDGRYGREVHCTQPYPVSIGEMETNLKLT